MGKDILINVLVAAVFCAAMSALAGAFLIPMPADQTAHIVNNVIGGVINGIFSAIAVTIVLYKKYKIGK